MSVVVFPITECIESLRSKPGERWIGYSIHGGALHIS